MAAGIHELAPHKLPAFITPPGETDGLFVFIVVFLILIVLMVGNFYFKLHALPEKMAHSANSAQLQLVGVLALLALFTHNNIFWVAALLLAAFRMPDFATPLGSIAQSLREMSDRLNQPAPLDPRFAPALAEGTDLPDAPPQAQAAAEPSPFAAPAPEMPQPDPEPPAGSDDDAPETRKG